MKKVLLGAVMAFAGSVYAEPEATAPIAEAVAVPTPPAAPAAVAAPAVVAPAPVATPAPVVQPTAPTPAQVAAPVVQPAAVAAPAVVAPAPVATPAPTPTPVTIVNQIAPVTTPAQTPKTGVEAEIESLEKENKLMSLRQENQKLKKYEISQAAKEASRASANRKSGFIIGLQGGASKVTAKSQMASINNRLGQLGLRAGYQKFLVNSLGFRIYGDVMGGGRDKLKNKNKDNNFDVEASQLNWAVNLDLMLDFNISKNVAFGIYGGAGYGASKYAQQLTTWTPFTYTTKKGTTRTRYLKDRATIEYSTKPDLIINAGAGITIKQKHRIEAFYKKTTAKGYIQNYDVTSKRGVNYAGKLIYKPNDIIGLSYQYTF